MAEIRPATKEEQAEYSAREKLAEERRQQCAKRGHYSTSGAFSVSIGDKNTGTYTCDHCGEFYLREMPQEEVDKFWENLNDGIPIKGVCSRL